MAKDYQITWPGHPNIYNNNSQRKFNIYFSEPKHKVNENTGILLLIPGFGGNANSNVYKKMRTKFADEYNLVTIQCDYFGQEFMQRSQSIQVNPSKSFLEGIFTFNEINEIYQPGFNLNKFIELGKKYSFRFPVKETLDETIVNFNDMGIMQALDNISAVLYVIKIIKDNTLSFNSKKIILFGHSHGAYLCYLCNAFAPGLFSLLIDNSSWLFPAYLKNPRYLKTLVGKMILEIEFDYFASHQNYDDELLNLSTLYQQVGNKCDIQCYQGVNDNLIIHLDKERFCNQVSMCSYNKITSDHVDHVVFNSTNHGLDADFINLFDYTMKDKMFETGVELSLRSVNFETKQGQYQIDYCAGLPQFTKTEKNLIRYT